MKVWVSDCFSISIVRFINQYRPVHFAGKQFLVGRNPRASDEYISKESVNRSNGGLQETGPYTSRRSAQNRSIVAHAERRMDECRGLPRHGGGGGGRTSPGLKISGSEAGFSHKRRRVGSFAVLPTLALILECS